MTDLPPIAAVGVVAPAQPALPVLSSPVPTALRAALQRPLSGRAVAVGLLVYVLVWLLFLGWTSRVPPVDNIEQLTWVRSVEWGYFKHPPLPTWLMAVAVRLFGASAWTSYGLGALCTLSGMGLFWRLMLRLRGPMVAAVALLAVLCITSYNYRLYYFNHNVVLLPLVVAAAALTERAFATRRLRWWLALGAVMGLGLLTKYQMVVAALAVLVFWLQQRAWRDSVHRQGLLAAVLVAVLVFLPHLNWLVHNNFAPISYAMHTSLGVQLGAGQRTAGGARWLLDQLGNRALPAWLLLAFAAYAPRGCPALLPPAAPVAPAARIAVRAFLLIWGGVPLGFMALVGLLGGAELQLHWGTPFLPFAVPAVMALWPGRPWAAPQTLQRAWWAFLPLQALLMVLSLLSSPRGVPVLNDKHWRHFNAQALAAAIAEPARQALGGPVRVISGPGGMAGALALHLAERPLVLIDGRADRSPWVPPDLVARCGVLELGAAGLSADARPVGPVAPGLYWHVRRGQDGPDACSTAKP